MNQNSENNLLLGEPSAWIPLVMSLAALLFVLGYAAIFGIARQADEGTPAHIFQLVMLAQLPIAGYFALKWLPRRPLQALLVLALQAVAWTAPIITVMWLESL